MEEHSLTPDSAGRFGPFEKKMFDAGLPEIAIRTFRHYYERLLGGERGTLSRREIEPVTDLPRAETLEERPGEARAALERSVVIKLNGGLGTSMGMTQAKSLLPVKDGLSFLDIIARQVLELRREYGCRVPLVLMNSFRTREDSLAALARYPDLASDVPLDFLQHKVPRIRAEDLAPVEWPAEPEYEWCPPGHGDIYTALLTSGMLEQLLGAGYQYAFVSNADNLGAVLDLRILSWFAQEDLPFAMEVCERAPSHRKGGHLAARSGGGLVLRELAQCPEDELESFQDIRVYRYFNTNNLWVNLEALSRILEERRGVLALPMICNEKSVDPTDPSSTRVFQLETAMGAAISVFEGGRALHVSPDRFAPVKATTDLLAIWSDAFSLTDDYRIVSAKPGGEPAPVVELDSAFYRRVDDLRERFPKGAPSLIECRRLRVRGDVYFGGDVVCRGDVEIGGAGAETRTVPDGAVLSG